MAQQLHMQIKRKLSNKVNYTTIFSFPTMHSSSLKYQITWFIEQTAKKKLHHSNIYGKLRQEYSWACFLNTSLDYGFILSDCIKHLVSALSEAPQFWFPIKNNLTFSSICLNQPQRVQEIHGLHMVFSVEQKGFRRKKIILC